VPFIARWPGRISAASVSDEVISLNDMLATFADIIEVPLAPGAGEDSYSIVPALFEERQSFPIREAVVLHSQDGMFAIRQGRWKLILGQGSGGFTEPKRITADDGMPEWQLYDLVSDPREQVNLLDEHPDVVGHLTALLLKYRAQGHSRPDAAAALE
jgi:arylsulfatase A